jgi:hypothetical protein
MHDSNTEHAANLAFLRRMRIVDRLILGVYVLTCLGFALFMACNAVWWADMTGEAWHLGASAMMTLCLGFLSLVGRWLMMDLLGIGCL